MAEKVRVLEFFSRAYNTSHFCNAYDTTMAYGYVNNLRWLRTMPLMSSILSCSRLLPITRGKGEILVQILL